MKQKHALEKPFPILKAGLSGLSGAFMLPALAVMILLAPSEPARADDTDLRHCITHHKGPPEKGHWADWHEYNCDKPATFAFCFSRFVVSAKTEEDEVRHGNVGWHERYARSLHCSNGRFADPCIFFKDSPGQGCNHPGQQAVVAGLESYWINWAICEGLGNVPQWEGAYEYSCDGAGIEESEDSIRDMQNALSQLGFDPGPADGLWGRRTETAAVDYIRSRGGEVEPGNRRQIMVEVFSLRTSDERVLAEEPDTVVNGGQAPVDTFRDCDSCPEMIVVPGGSFTMGSPASEEGRGESEGPQHRVSIKKFAVGKYEVTFNEWGACVSGGGCGGYHPDDRGWGRNSRPVIHVSWYDAKSYVEWLSRRTGHQYRLLSESEWEYAARAGTRGPFHFGSTISTDQANYHGDYTYGNGRKGVFRGETMPVGSFPPNGFGLHDVHGNVREWVEDCWHGSYAGVPNDGSAWTTGGDCADQRVLRGGSWLNRPRYLRSADRYGYESGDRSGISGFRVARTLAP